MPPKSPLVLPKSPLALESVKTQKELAELLNCKENRRVRATASESVPEDRIYFKVKHSPLKQTQNNSFLTPAVAAMIVKELKEDKQGCLKQGSLDTNLWNSIRNRIRDKGLEVAPEPKAYSVSKATVTRMSMANNRNN